MPETTPTEGDLLPLRVTPGSAWERAVAGLPRVELRVVRDPQAGPDGLRLERRLLLPADTTE